MNDEPKLKTTAIETTQRSFGKWVEIGLKVLAAATALVYIYTAWWGLLPPLKQRAIILLVCMVFTFLYNPMRKRTLWGWTFYVDCGLALLSTSILIYIMLNETTIAYQMTIAHPLALAVGIAFLLLILEATRRVAGWILVILPFSLLIYALLGKYLPGVLHHAGIDWDFLITIAAYSTEGGVFSLPLHVASTVIIIFLIFSAFLRFSGAQFFFIDLPHALFGWMRGGPAKMAVVASGLLGTLTGSVVANVVGTGAFTIPLMKRTGYRPAMAGAIEAMASTGGQFMPPVMGAAAFIMAEFLNTSYWSICVAAAIPALLYYVSLFSVVDLEAAKTQLKGIPLSELPSIRKTLASGWFLLIPVIALIFLMAGRWSPMKACFVALVLTVIVSQASRGSRMGPRKIFDALAQSVKDAVLVTVVCAAAGIMICIINMTGLGVRMSALLIEISGGYLLILLILTMITSIILGMGLTTSACYIFLALLTAPALIEMGVVPMAAHLFILYFGCLSAITPPVCIGSYAAAALAGSKPMETGFLAWRLALVAFILPFFFVYQPALISKGSIGTIALAFTTAIIGVISFTVMLQGYLLKTTSKPERVLFGIGGLFLIYPGLLTDTIGIISIVLALTSHILLGKRKFLTVGISGE